MRRPRNIRALIPILVGLVGMTAWQTGRTPDAHASGAPDMTIKANSTASDQDVSAIVEVRAEPGTKCSTSVRKSRFVRTLPVLTLGASGISYWQWRINGRVTAGKWSVAVACDGHGHGWRQRQTISFPAVAGVGPGKASELFVRGSLTTGSIKGPPSGSGGGGPKNLYPHGQCTWWVSLQRPDLPWFPGTEGNALNWVAAARKRHIATGSIPAVGAVAVFAPNQYGAGIFGHVAYVTAVEEGGNTIEVSESNFEHADKPDIRRVPSLNLTFIYRGPAPTSPEVSHIEPLPEKKALPPNHLETPGGIVHTWSDYVDAGGQEGASIPAYFTVEIACKVSGFTVQDGNQWWYRIASPPWSGSYYGSADAFYNDGATSGSLAGTPFVDPAVPSC